MKKRNLIGQKFGLLLVVGECHERKQGRIMWDCLCDCGKTTMVTGSSMVSGMTRSCGCVRDALLVRRSRTHGFTKSPTYSVWRGMKERCQNRQHIGYRFYGGRGIKICEAWNYFNNFLSDMGERPKNFQLDRIDPKKDYTKDNCRWVDLKTQGRNSSWVKLSQEASVEIIKRKKSGERVVSLALCFGVSRSAIYRVLNGSTWS